MNIDYKIGDCEKKYVVIYADPPWPYEQFSEKAHGSHKPHYSSMEIEEIKALPIERVVADDSVLFLWATFPKMREALQVIESWGFDYKTVAFVWVKKNKKGSGFMHGVGFHTASNVEVCLLGKRGSPKRKDTGISQLIFSRLTRHSEKPKEAYVRIERLYGDVPRIELFARYRREGWDVWGDEIPKTTQKLLIQEAN